MFTKESAKSELAYELEKGYATIDQLEDRLAEFVDSSLPVYYSDIIKDWQAMPSEYDGRGVLEMGAPAEPTVYNLMTADLYFYHYDLYQDALGELEDALELIESEAN